MKEKNQIIEFYFLNNKNTKVFSFILGGNAVFLTQLICRKKHKITQN